MLLEVAAKILIALTFGLPSFINVFLPIINMMKNGGKETFRESDQVWSIIM